MKQLYKGPIHILEIHTINPIIKSTAFESYVIQKDSLFYRNRMGKYINFEHDTVLPDKYEAEANLLEIARLQKMTPIESHCIYADDSEIKPFKEITNQEFKVLKKAFKK